VVDGHGAAAGNDAELSFDQRPRHAGAGVEPAVGDLVALDLDVHQVAVGRIGVEDGAAHGQRIDLQEAQRGELAVAADAEGDRQAVEVGDRQRHAPGVGAVGARLAGDHTHHQHAEQSGPYEPLHGLSFLDFHSLITRGVMKISSSSLPLLWRRLRKRWPRMGMSARPGTRSCPWSPITVVPPSRTITRVCASLVAMGALVAPTTAKASCGSRFCTWMSISTVPSAVTCGVTCRRSVALTNCTVTVLLATVWIGICRPLWTSAEVLLSVATLGADRMLIRPSFSAAWSVASSWKVLRMLPRCTCSRPLLPPVSRLTLPWLATLLG